jgi:beta-glucuronidase
MSCLCYCHLFVRHAYDLYAIVLQMRIYLSLIVISLLLLPCMVHGMLYPYDTETRTTKSLNGVWKFKADLANEGMTKRWYAAPLPTPTIHMSVPSSYNDIVQDDAIRRHVGWVWYEREIRYVKQDTRTWLRFAGAHYYTAVYINGRQVMNHTGGHLPFEADITHYLSAPSNRLTVAVNNTLTPVTIPPGTLLIPIYHTNNTFMYISLLHIK